MGSQFAQDLRGVALQRYRDLYRTYGVRSFRYAEMVFGNTVNVRRLRAEVPQEPGVEQHKSNEHAVLSVHRHPGAWARSPGPSGEVRTQAGNKRWACDVPASAGARSRQGDTGDALKSRTRACVPAGGRQYAR